MAYEWVAPVVTGAVGITGVVATYLTGREGREAAATLANQQREHASADRLRDEKKKAYSSFLDATSKARLAMLRITQLLTDEKYGAARKMRSEATGELNHQREQVRLVGSPRVREYTRAVFTDYLEAFGRLIVREPAPLDHGLLGALLANMKLDLGHELSEQDEAMLDYPVPPVENEESSSASSVPEDSVMTDELEE